MPPIGNCPTFSYHGSKANIAKWLISLFPNNINTFYEVFAGRANITFRLLTTEEYLVNQIILNDKFNHDWLSVLKEYDGDYSFIPDVVNQQVFEKWRDSEPSIERTMIEPIVCYHSNRYNMNSAASSDIGSTFYSPNFAANWRKKLILAHNLLQRCKITNYDFIEFFHTFSFKSDDFIYLDPPYCSKYDEKRTYPNINHEKLLEIIQKLPCRVGISNYFNDLYANSLKNWNFFDKNRVSLAKGRQKGHANHRTEVRECFWRNY